MKILVVTMYDGVTNEDVHEWADRIFKDTVAAKFDDAQMKGMKKDFLQGLDVVASSHSPDRKQSATTRWKLTK